MEKIRKSLLHMRQRLFKAFYPIRGRLRGIHEPELFSLLGTKCFEKCVFYETTK